MRYYNGGSCVFHISFIYDIHIDHRQDYNGIKRVTYHPNCSSQIVLLSLYYYSYYSLCSPITTTILLHLLL